MSETPVPRSERPGVLSVVFYGLLACLFAVKATYWWIGVWEGTTVVGKMTAWEWVSIGFYHVAVVVGVFSIIEMLRARSRSGGNEPKP